MIVAYSKLVGRGLAPAEKSTGEASRSLTGMIVTHTKPVGVDVLGDPRNKQILLSYGGERVKPDRLRDAKDVVPYEYDYNQHQAVGANSVRPQSRT